MAKNQSVTIGEYIVEIDGQSKVQVYRVSKSTLAELKQCADEKGFAYSDTVNTQTLGKNLLKEFCEGASSGVVGEVFIERAENGHIDAYRTYGNTKGALRDISDAIGFDYDGSWTTQQFGAKLVKYVGENGPFDMAKTAKENASNPAEENPTEENPTGEVDFSFLGWADIRDINFAMEIDMTRFDGTVEDLEDGEHCRNSKGGYLIDVCLANDEECESVVVASTEEEDVYGYALQYVDEVLGRFDDDSEVNQDVVEYSSNIEIVAADSKFEQSEGVEDRAKEAYTVDFAAYFLQAYHSAFYFDTSWPKNCGGIARVRHDGGSQQYLIVNTWGGFELELDSLTDAQWEAVKRAVAASDRYTDDDDFDDAE